MPAVGAIAAIDSAWTEARKAAAWVGSDLAVRETEIADHVDAAEKHLRQAYEAAAGCDQCGLPMTAAERVMGPVCGRCCRANHRKAAGR